MNATIVDMPVLRLCAVRHIGAHEGTPEAFGRLAEIAGPAGLCDQSDITPVAVFHDAPDGTESSRLCSHAAIVVADNAVLPPGLAELRLAAGRYARATHVGPYHGLPEAWTRLIHQWLPTHGYRTAAGARYAFYRNTLLDVSHHELRTDLYVPVHEVTQRDHPSHAATFQTDGYHFREDLLPISLLVTQRTLGLGDVHGVFAYYRGLCRRGIRFVAISDVRISTGMPDARTRQSFGEESARFAPESKLWSLGSGLVVNSPLIRRALTAIEWISRPDPPSRYFSDLPSAVDWAIERLLAEDMPITPAIHDFWAKVH